MISFWASCSITWPAVGKASFQIIGAWFGQGQLSLSFLSCKQSDAERKDFVDIPEPGNSWFYTSSGFLFLSSVT